MTALVTTGKPLSVVFMNRYYDANILYDAGTKAMKGTRWKYSTQLYKINQLLETAKLQNGLECGAYRPTAGSKFVISERGKTRYITSASVQDRAVNHVICDEVLTPCLQKYLQYDNSASQKNKGVTFHRKRFETHLHRYYREHGSNDGYILLWDYSGYYANIPHDKCIELINGYLNRERLDPQERELTKRLIADTFKTFEADVSRFSDDEIAQLYSGKASPMLNNGVADELLTGEKWLCKGVDIGNQQSQSIGVIYPCRVDNYIKMVCGFKHYGRYTDDCYLIDSSKERLLQTMDGVRKIASEYGLIINESKTRICRLDREFRHLQVLYKLTDTGRLIRKINPKAVTRERRRLKAHKRLLDAGRMEYSQVESCFKSWISGNCKYMSHKQIQGLSRLYKSLFGKGATWKKQHGRLRWQMTL